MHKAAGTGGTIHYYHRNQQYSITALTTSSGAVAERYAYKAYGAPSILNASGTVLTSSAIGNRYTYTGREWDEKRGLHHFRARWMSPLAGRFLGRDSIGYEGSPWDLYEFMKSLPLHNVDPSGKYATPGCITDPYSDPPIAPFTGSKCRIAVRCGPVRFRDIIKVGVHCGLIIEVDDGVFSIDETGGCENNFNRKSPPSDYGTIFAYTDHDISVCECLRLKSNVSNDKDIPRQNGGNKSNTSSGCLAGKCSIQINFGWTLPWNTPWGF